MLGLAVAVRSMTFQKSLNLQGNWDRKDWRWSGKRGCQWVRVSYNEISDEKETFRQKLVNAYDFTILV